MTRLFEETPTTLAEKEKTFCHSGVLKFADSINEAQKKELSVLLIRVLDKEETPAWGRGRVVEFMMRERGVATWATKLRRGIESVKIEA